MPSGDSWDSPWPGSQPEKLWRQKTLELIKLDNSCTNVVCVGHRILISTFLRAPPMGSPRLWPWMDHFFRGLRARRSKLSTCLPSLRSAHRFFYVVSISSFFTCLPRMKKWVKNLWRAVTGGTLRDFDLWICRKKRSRLRTFSIGIWFVGCPVTIYVLSGSK